MDTDNPWHEPGKWFSPPIYWDTAVQRSIPNQTREVGIVDSTISEGVDMIGCHLGWNEWLEITARLDEMGVKQIIDPMGQPIDTLADYVTAVKEEGVTADIQHKGVIEHFPLEEDGAWVDELRSKLQIPYDVMLLLGFPPKKADVWQDFGREGGMSKAEFVENATLLVTRANEIATDLGRDVEFIYGIGYAFDHTLDRLTEFAAAVAEADADGYYLFDSTGHSVPQVTRRACAAIKNTAPALDLYVQHHNDLGMATACSLAAAEGGADFLDVTIAGVGDRGGTAAIEEVTCVLESMGWKTDVDLGQLNDLADYVQNAMGFEVSPHRPIIGSQINQEEGLGHRDQDDPPESSMAVSGEVLGRPFESVVGWNVFTKERYVASGDMGDFVQDTIAEWGYELTEAEWERIEQRLIDQLQARDYISLREFRSVVEGVRDG